MGVGVIKNHKFTQYFDTKPQIYQSNITYVGQSTIVMKVQIILFHLRSHMPISTLYWGK